MSGVRSMTALPTDSTRTAMTAEKIAVELRERANAVLKAAVPTVWLHDRLAAKCTAQGITTLLDDYDRLKARVAEMERKLLLTPMAERIAELPDFMAAMSEWGCEDPNEQADAITAFLNSAVGLREYLEDQSKAGGRDGH